MADRASSGLNTFRSQDYAAGLCTLLRVSSWKIKIREKRKPIIPIETITVKGLNNVSARKEATNIATRNPRWETNSNPLKILPNRSASLSLWIKAFTPIRAGDTKAPKIKERRIAHTTIHLWRDKIYETILLFSIRYFYKMPLYRLLIGYLNLTALNCFSLAFTAYSRAFFVASGTHCKSYCLIKKRASYLNDDLACES